jgi:hypothetical protein
LVPSRQITVTQHLSPLTGTGKKCGTPTRTPTQLNRRAVSKHTKRKIIKYISPADQINKQ